MTVKLRNCQESDLPFLVELFRRTVWTINAKDYTQEQLEIWAPDSIDPKSEWWLSLLRTTCFVAFINREIVGFANLTKVGLVDFFFVHHRHIGEGIGKMLYQALEKEARQMGMQKLTAEASLTALPFFEKQGFQKIKKQSKQKQHVVLTNFLMGKDL